MVVDKIHCFEFGEYRLDITNNQLLRNNVPVSITQKSFEILLFLIENQGIVLKKEDLLDALWEGNFVEESTLTQHIYMLRKALKKKGDEPNYIETIPKIGYRFVGEVEEVFYENPHPHITVNHVYPDSTESVSTSINDEIVYFKSLTESGKISAYVEEKAKTIIQQPEKRSSKNYVAIAILIITGFFLLGYALYEGNVFSGSPSEQNLPQKVKSIAVLPFKIIGEGKDEKLGLGMADALISKLGNLEGISVRPTSTIIRFTENENEDLFEIGRKLEVDAILVGTIQRDNDLIRINVQFYRVSDQTQIATEKFDEKYSNIFSIQDRISEKIAQKLFLKKNSKNDSLKYLEYSTNTEAYQAYSLGLFHWNKRTEENMEKAVAYFKIAIEKDPKFANAYAYLSDSYTLIGYYRMRLMPSDMAFSKGEEMANKALELDANSSEAMTSLATIYSIKGEGEKGANLLRKAIEINPNNSTARIRLAWAYIFEGNLEKSIEEMKLAQILDPLSTTTNLALAQLMYLARRPDESISYSRRALEIDSDSIDARRWIADAFEQKGLYKEAVAELNGILNLHQNDGISLLSLSRLYEKEKKFDESKKFLEKGIKAESSTETLYQLALYNISLGNTDKAIELLEKYQSGTNGSYAHFKHDYQLDPLRSNPKFKKLLPPSDRSS
jgi:DNA-binding winged helix-turn-helix (wHTH) protein/TolB-like protein/Tfp pilus assembly protein PilF